MVIRNDALKSLAAIIQNIDLKTPVKVEIEKRPIENPGESFG